MDDNAQKYAEEQQMTNDRRYAQMLLLKHKITDIPPPAATVKQEMSPKEATEASITLEQMNQLRTQEETRSFYPAESENGEKLERRYRVHNRIGTRIAFLSNLPADVIAHLRLKAEIEVRALQLLNLQTQTRNEVINILKRDTTLEGAFNSYAYRSVKRQSLREACVTEKLGKQQQVDEERSRRQKHIDRWQAIVEHAKEFKALHRNKQVKQSKVKKAVLIYYANDEKERKKDKRMDSNAKVDARGQLLDERKDKRLIRLLKQTDEYVGILTGLAKRHQAKERRRKRAERWEQVAADDAADVCVHIREMATARCFRWMKHQQQRRQMRGLKHTLATRYSLTHVYTGAPAR